MTDLCKAAEMALQQLQRDDVYLGHRSKTRADAIEALRQALAEPANSTTGFVEPKVSSQTEQKPLVWMNKYGHVASFQSEEYKDPLYTAPSKREWVGLTEDDVVQTMYRADAIVTGPMQFKFAKAIEAKLKEKNT